ncbi:MAG TPA: alpha amylase C-terminal domain-containing protein, partial [Polyangia bacterium]
ANDSALQAIAPDVYVDGDTYFGAEINTLAFARAGGRFFIVATFNTPDQAQNLGWLGLPGGATYKEIFNSSWPAYRAGQEPERANGGYGAVLDRNSIVNLPPVGAIVLERR